MAFSVFLTPKCSLDEPYCNNIFFLNVVYTYLPSLLLVLAFQFFLRLHMLKHHVGSLFDAGKAEQESRHDSTFLILVTTRNLSQTCSRITLASLNSRQLFID